MASSKKNYTLLPSSSLVVHDGTGRFFDDNTSDNDIEDIEDIDDIEGTDMARSSSTESGYPADDVEGKTAIEVKTAIITRALEETGMGRYQWCMYAPLPSLPLLSR